MKTTFKVRDKQYELSLERREKGEEDKFNPFTVTVSGQAGGPVTGTMQLTDEVLKKAEEETDSSSESAEALLARACARSLAAELVIRKLKPDFSFIVDHRWLQ